MKTRLHKLLALPLALLLLLSAAACHGAPEEAETPLPQGPELSQMQAICELAVMECYYHTVAKFLEEDAEGILWWQKDKHFWVEYSGVVTLGIDASLVSLEVEGDQVTITIPPAIVLKCDVDAASLSEDSYIVAKDSAAITAEDEVEAFTQAQALLEETAQQDQALLSTARQQAQALLEEYVTNLGEQTGRQYAVRWVYLEGAGSPASSPLPEEEAPAA